MSNLILWDINGNEIDLDQYGLFGLRLIVPSPSYSESRDSVPGRPGSIGLGKDLLPRNLIAIFKISSPDFDTSFILRDKIYSLLSAGNTFYIGDIRQPEKRWLVDCSEQWTPERINTVSMSFDIPLVAESGCAESVKNTLNPNLFSVQLADLKPIKYKHTSTSFEIFNDGVKVDPRYLPIVITYKGGSTNLKIKNITTNEEWTYTGTSNSGDLIVLDGIRSTKNGLSIFRDTNKKLLTLAPGWNKFVLEGTSGSFEISFNFRFYTL